METKREQGDSWKQKKNKQKKMEPSNRREGKGENSYSEFQS